MQYSYIDTHAHLNISAFKEDWRDVATHCEKESVAVINIGTKASTSQIAAKIASQYDHCYAIIGLHPIQTTPAYHDNQEIGEGSAPFASKGEEFNPEYFRELAKHPKIVGIGECGFDFYRVEADTKEVQEEAFIAQIELANELELPLMIHTRDARGQQGPVYDETFRVLKQYAKVPGNIHFFAGSYEHAKKFFDIGFTVSFTGVITFAQEYEEVVAAVPLDLMHAETDCPYVAPVPHRGKRCEPWMVKDVCAKIADIKGQKEEDVRTQLLENAHKLYRL